MSDFQSRFMGVVGAAHNTNLSLAARYTEDSGQVIDDLYREVSEIQQAKAHLDELQDRNRLRMFFNGAEERFHNGLKKYCHEFTAEVNETYRSYDKKLKTIFTEQGVRAKDIYTHIDSRSEEDYTVFAAKSDNVSLVTDALIEVQIQAAEQAEKVIRKAKRKKIFFGVLLPVILAIPFFLISMFVEVLLNSNEESGNIAFMIQIVTAIEKMFTKYSAASGATLAIVLVAATVWLIYYTVLKYAIKRQMIRNLGAAMSAVYNAFATRRTELRDAFASYLASHLEFMNTQYFIKYKPLIDAVVRQEGEK